MSAEQSVAGEKIYLTEHGHSVFVEIEFLFTDFWRRENMHRSVSSGAQRPQTQTDWVFYLIVLIVIYFFSMFLLFCSLHKLITTIFLDIIYSFLLEIIICYCLPLFPMATYWCLKWISCVWPTRLSVININPLKIHCPNSQNPKKCWFWLDFENLFHFRMILIILLFITVVIATLCQSWSNFVTFLLKCVTFCANVCDFINFWSHLVTVIETFLNFPLFWSHPFIFCSHLIMHSLHSRRFSGLGKVKVKTLKTNLQSVHQLRQPQWWRLFEPHHIHVELHVYSPWSQPLAPLNGWLCLWSCV